MQVENIECQIAQAQIGNFLAGSGLSPEAMEQLEDHIAGCANCKTVLNERRSELKAMLTGQKAVVDFEKIAKEAEATKTNSISTALRKKSLQQMLEPTPEPVKPTPVPQAFAAVMAEAAAKETPKSIEAPKIAKKPSQLKPLLYSLALAAVLIGMSYFSGNIAELFGPKLAAATAPVEKVETPATTTPATTPASTPETTSTVDASTGTTGSVVSTNPSVPETTTPPSTAPSTESSTGTHLAVASMPTTPESTPVEEPVIVGPEEVGTSAGALATTQFQASTPATPEAPVTKPTPPAPAKPVVAPKPAAAKPVVAKRQVPARRIVRKRPVKRVAAKRATPVRSRGIKVYNP